MIAGTLEVQMLANLARLSADMQQAKNMVSTSMKSIEASVALAQRALAGLGIGIGVGYFASLINGSIDAMDHLNDLSKATKITVEDLSGLKLAAKQSGSDLDSIAQSIQKLGQNVGKDPQKYRELGLTAKDNLGMFMQLSDIFTKLENDQQRNAVMATALGKSWQGAAPLLSEGSKKIQEMVDKGKALSGMTKQAAQDADELKDKAAELATSFEAGRNKLVIQLMPALNDIIHAMAEAAKETNGLTAVLVGFGGVLSWLFGLGEQQQTVKRLKEMNAEIKVLEASLNSGTLNPTGKTGGWMSFLFPDIKMSDEALFKAQQNLQKLKKERDALAEPPKTKPEAGPNAAEQAAAAAAAAKFLIDQKAAQSALAALKEARAKNELEALKDSLGHQQQMLDLQHQMFLVGDQEYYSRKLGFAREEAAAEMKVLNQLLQEQRGALGKTTPDTGEYYKALKDVEETISKQAKVTREFGQIAEVSYMQARKASEDYKRSIEAINIQIMQLTGETAKAASAQFELQNRDKRLQAVANNDPAGVAAIDRLGKLTASQAEFNQEREKLAEVNARLQIQEERIQNAIRTGAISELDSMQQTSDARQNSVAQQQVIITNLQRIAAESANPALKLQAEQAASALEKLRSEADLVGQKLNTIFVTAAGDEFANFINKTKTAKQAFADFATSVTQQINRMVSEALAKKLFNALGFGGDSTGAGGIGGLFSKLLGGSSAGAGASNMAFGGTTFAEAFAGGVIPMAGGGDFMVNRPTLFLAGEAGPERASFSGANNQSEGGSIIVHNHFQIEGPTDRRSQLQIAAAAGEGVQRAMGRNS